MHLHVVSSPYWLPSSRTPAATPAPTPPTPGVGVGFLGWVSDRDAQHRPLTHIAKRAKKGIEIIHFDKFWQKGVEIRHFLVFAQVLGSKLNKLSTDLEKGGQNGGVYVVFIKWVPSSGAGPVFCLLLGVSSDCAWPITGQVTSVTWPVIGWA